jgi:F0F1-type ATP synthase assembly protein I
MEPEADEKQARVRRAMRLLALGIACALAVGVAIGVLYDPHAGSAAIGFHIAAACFGLGGIMLLVGLVIVAALGVRGRDVPPRGRSGR